MNNDTPTPMTAKLLDPDAEQRVLNKPRGLKVPSLVDKDALAEVKRRGGRWAAFQNHDIHSFPSAGHIKFLAFGAPHNTFPTAEALPAHYPDPSISQGHNYLLVGEIDFATCDDGTSSGIKPIA